MANKLNSARGLLAVLEPGGGLGPNQVKKLSGSGNDAYLPESGILPIKREIQGTVETSAKMLESLAANDEISDVLDRLISYIAIIPDLQNTFALPSLKKIIDIQPEQTKKLDDIMQKGWQDLQNQMFGRSSSLTLGIHQFLADWLTFGKIWACIVRDPKQPNEISKIVLQTTEPETKTDANGYKHIYTVDSDLVLTGEDVILLQYTEIDVYVVSYVASLLRSFNIYRTIERTRIANAVMSATFRKVYTVPTNGLGKVKAKQRLSTIMGMYRRQVTYDDRSGEIKVNGENNYPINTEIWMAGTAAGDLRIDSGGSDAEVTLNNLDLVEYVARKFYKRAKLPMSKYEAVDAGYLSGIGELDEDERQFKLLISKFRAVIGKFFIKILWRAIEKNTDIVGDNKLKDIYEKYAYLSFFDEIKSETPLEQLDNLSDALSKVEDVLDTYQKTLENAGCPENLQKGLLNALRRRLTLQYCPAIVNNKEIDMSMVPKPDEVKEGDTPSGDGSYGNNTGDAGSDSDAGSASMDSNDNDYNGWDW